MAIFVSAGLERKSKMRKTILFAGIAASMALSAVASANILETYESYNEGFLGSSFDAGMVRYRDVNNVSGVQPDGEVFGPGDLGDQLIIENAGLFYNDFPDFGSPNNALTFGNTYVPGDNLSIGALASVYMDMAVVSTDASLDIAFYENGPWGNIVYHLDALHDGNVVATDTYTLADGGGRDNPNFTSLAISNSYFETLHLYATLNGNYVGARGMIDNLDVSPVPVPEPATLAALGLGLAAVIRRRKAGK